MFIWLEQKLGSKQIANNNNARPRQSSKSLPDFIGLEANIFHFLHFQRQKADLGQRLLGRRAGDSTVGRLKQQQQSRQKRLIRHVG